MEDKDGAPQAQQETSLAKLDQSDYVEMERRDEQQITQELMGQVVEEWVYYVVRNGKRIPNLSYVGIKNIVREMGCIRISEPVVIETREDSLRGKGFRAMVMATDTKTGQQVPGVSWASLFIKNSTAIDEFAEQKAVSKSVRNAEGPLIPAKMSAKVIDKWLQEHGIKPEAKESAGFRGAKPVKESKPIQTPGGKPVSDTPLQDAFKKGDAIDGDFKDGTKVGEPGPEPKATGKQVTYAEKLMGVLTAEGRAGVLKARGVRKVGDLGKNACSDLIDELESIVKAQENASETTSDGGSK